MRLRSSNFLNFLLVFFVALAVSVQAATNELPASNQKIMQDWVDAWRENSQAESIFINRLILSGSAYLKQHANNPIDWYPWAEPAFAKAKQENKLILLSIGYASCHWCHVMEAESFSDIDIAMVLNRGFVSIKVDREQLPDIDAYYTMVVETMRGESGWPMTLVLTPDRKPVFAANYLGKTQFLTVLNRMNKIWQEAPETLHENARLFSGEIERNRETMATKNPTPNVAYEETAQKNLLASIDKQNGGFGDGIKFPNEIKLQFLLNAYKANQSQDLKEILVQQLDSLMNSGLNDVVFGGVFRYASNRQMTRPHFEKMLYNQALTVKLFADAAVWMEKPSYSQYANSIVRFVDQNMRLEDGLFAAAIDADHAGNEGGYYVWPASDLTDVPSGISSVLIGENHFYLYRNSTGPDLSAWQTQMRRLRGTAPKRIDNRLTAWNALWLSAMLQVNEIDEATHLAETLWSSAWDGNQLLRMGDQAGFLDDYSYFSNALWQTYLKTGEIQWKHKARLLDKRMLELFFREKTLSYGGQSKDIYVVDIYQDKELPSPAAATLNSLRYHQTNLEFIAAYETLANDAQAAIGNKPEYFLSLIQQSFSFPESEQVIARGNGMISLRSSEIKGHWQVVINLDPDWHINASKTNNKSLVPLKLSSKGRSVDIHYPDGIEMIADFSDSPLSIYSDQVLIDVTSTEAERQIELQVKLQACSDRVCLLPELVTLKGLRQALR